MLNVHCGLIAIQYDLLHLVFLCFGGWSVHRGIRKRVSVCSEANEKHTVTWCLRCRWHTWSSSAAGWARGCSSSLRSLPYRMLAGCTSLMQWVTQSPLDCLSTIHQTFPVLWVDSVLATDSLQRSRVTVTAAETESKEKPSIVYMLLPGQRVLAHQLENTKAAYDWKWHSTFAAFSLAFFLCQEKFCSQLILLQQNAFIPLRTF